MADDGASLLARLAAATAAPPTSRVPLERRAVSAAFLTELFGADGRSADGPVTPGQLVHGRHTQGPPNDWQEYDATRDPLWREQQLPSQQRAHRRALSPRRAARRRGA